MATDGNERGPAADNGGAERVEQVTEIQAAPAECGCEAECCGPDAVTVAAVPDECLPCPAQQATAVEPAPARPTAQFGALGPLVCSVLDADGCPVLRVNLRGEVAATRPDWREVCERFKNPQPHAFLAAGLLNLQEQVDWLRALTVAPADVLANVRKHVDEARALTEQIVGALRDAAEAERVAKGSSKTPAPGANTAE